MSDDGFGVRDYLTPLFGVLAVVAEVSFSLAEYYWGFTEYPFSMILLGIISGLFWKAMSINENLDPLIHWYKS